mgnify:CR=1 FL=1
MTRPDLLPVYKPVGAFALDLERQLADARAYARELEARVAELERGAALGRPPG